MLKFNFFKLSFIITPALLASYDDVPSANQHRYINQTYLIKMILLVVITNVLLVNRTNAGLSESIQNNLLNYNQSYERVTKSKIIKEAPARLWIHIRSDDQSTLVKDIYRLTSTIKLNGLSIKQKAFLKVPTGPYNSQLRFFKSADQSNAKYLVNQLRKLIPSIETVDLSGKYNSVSWIKSGHFEIWLSIQANSEN
ncbi:MAG: hypothetical protein V7784_11200 [Oceanospirillaceae bacterium]